METEKDVPTGSTNLKEKKRKPKKEKKETTKSNETEKTLSETTKKQPEGKRINNHITKRILLIAIITLIISIILVAAIMLDQNYPDSRIYSALSEFIGLSSQTKNQQTQYSNLSARYVINLNEFKNQKEITNLSSADNLKINNHTDNNIFLQVTATENQEINVNTIIKSLSDKYKAYYYYPLNSTGGWIPPIGSSGIYLTNLTLSNGTKMQNKTIKIIIMPKKKIQSLNIKRTIYAKEGENITLPLDIINNSSDLQITSENLPEGATLKEGVLSWNIPYNFVQRDIISKILLKYLKINLNPKRKYTLNLKITNPKTKISYTNNIFFIINNTDKFPVINISPVITLKEGQTFDINSLKNKIYDPNGDYISTTKKGWEPEGKLNYNDVGVHNTTFFATNFVTESNKTIYFNVIRENFPPHIKSIQNKEIYEGKSIKQNITATDPNNETITYEISTPLNYVLENNTFIYRSENNLFSDIPHNISKIIYPVNITATDTSGLNSTTAFNITIKRRNYAPKILNSSQKMFIAEINKPINLSLKTKDPNNYPLKYIWNLNFYNKEITTNKSWIIATFTTPGEKQMTVKVTNGYNSTEYKFIADVYKKAQLKTTSTTKETSQQQITQKQPETQTPATYVIEETKTQAQHNTTAYNSNISVVYENQKQNNTYIIG